MKSPSVGCAIGATGWWKGAVPAALLVTLGTGPSAAQERDSIPGVELGMVYETAYRPALGIAPFSGRFGGSGMAPQVEGIIGRDLRYSDRFQVMDSLPAGLVGGSVDYSLWDRLGAVWLVTGQLEGAGAGFILVVELHDVVYGQMKEQGRFRIPDAASSDFRMSVHRVSDQIVRWATGDPGMAASRIAFTMPTSDTTKDIFIIDSDGENLKRLTRLGTVVMSPTWSWDGTRLAFTTLQPGSQHLFELDLASGRQRTFEPLSTAQYASPAYAPDDRTLAFGVLGTTNDGIFTYDVERNCCLAQLSGGRWKDVSPTFSPDGRQVALNTDRFGIGVTQIMVMPAGGGDVETISPLSYTSGGAYAAPDWSPTGDLVAFHGQIKRGDFQILVADLKAGRRRVRQLTWEGNNEAPTWAPDGRHLAFVGRRDWGYGLFVVDVAFGIIRPLLRGVSVDLPDWSPALAPGGEGR